MVQLVLSSQISDQRKAVIKFRKLLAHEDIHPYLDKIVTSGVVPTFVAMLWRDHEAELQVILILLNSIEYPLNFVHRGA